MDNMSRTPTIRSYQFLKLLTGDETHHDGITPLVKQIVAHLKLLNTFNKLKETIIVGVESRIEQEKLWQCFLTMAVQKFHVFVSALKLKFNNNPEWFHHFMNQTLPSFDIILIWHAVLLNPKPMYDNFRANNFKMFLDYPFPLSRIEKAISNDSLKYEPDQALADDFTLFIEEYYVKIGSSERFNYNVYQPFDPYHIVLPIKCPICHEEIGVHQLTTLGKTGIADKLFEFVARTNCECGFHQFIDHQELRTRKLVADANKRTIMPSVYKYYSPDMNSDIKVDMLKKVDSNIKLFVRRNSQLLWDISMFGVINLSRQKLLDESLPVLSDYFEVNPIYLTIVSHTGIAIHEDLVGMAVRQERFIKNMVQLNWLYSPYIEMTINEAIDRYQKGILLLPPQGFIPTVDIDLVWHTHLLDLTTYLQYTQAVTGYLVDHRDKVETQQFDAGFTEMCKKYYKRYRQDYTICLCEYCTLKRRAAKNLFNRRESKVPLITVGDLSHSHVSSHNAIRGTQGRDEEGILPEDHYSYTLHYVNDPKAPAVFRVPYNHIYG